MFLVTNLRTTNQTNVQATWSANRLELVAAPRYARTHYQHAVCYAGNASQAIALLEKIWEGEHAYADQSAGLEVQIY